MLSSVSVCLCVCVFLGFSLCSIFIEILSLPFSLVVVVVASTALCGCLKQLTGPTDRLMNVYAAFCPPAYSSPPLSHSASLSACLSVPLLFQPSHNLYLFTLDFNENILKMRAFSFFCPTIYGGMRQIVDRASWPFLASIWSNVDNVVNQFGSESMRSLTGCGSCGLCLQLRSHFYSSSRGRQRQSSS